MTVLAHPGDPPVPTSAETELRRLLDIMAALRDRGAGCPWEVADAISRGDFSALADELGDLLFQVVFHARMAQEENRFEFADVARGIADKMVRRHPHVFGAGARSADWEEMKRAERAARAETGTLAGIPVGLPALTRARKLTERAARVGFDWPDPEAVLDKFEEEVAELRAELPHADPARLQDEVGDLLFVLANLARKLELDPEACLRHANLKFARRFAGVEARLAARGNTAGETTLDEMEAEWQAVKAAERGG
jgi:ATP diphosphatase